MVTELLNITMSLLPEYGAGFSRKIPLKKVEYRLFFHRTNAHTIKHRWYVHFFTRDDILFSSIAVDNKFMVETLKRADIYLAQFPVSVDRQRFFGVNCHWQEYSRHKGKPYYSYLCRKYQIDIREFEIYFHNMFNETSNDTDR